MEEAEAEGALVAGVEAAGEEVAQHREIGVTEGFVDPAGGVGYEARIEKQAGDLDESLRLVGKRLEERGRLSTGGSLGGEETLGAQGGFEGSEKMGV